MSKKPINMHGLLAAKGHGTPVRDAPSRTIARRGEETSWYIRPSSTYVNLGFKVPREFRHHIRKLAAHHDISMVEVLRQALKLYEDQL